MRPTTQQRKASEHRATTSAWSPFRYKVFTVLWVATVVANIGGWMYSAACGWLMTDLNSTPLVVSLVQVANSLPVFLVAIPAGALVDIVDKRKFLILGEISVSVISTVFAAMVWLRLVTPTSLLVFAFLVAAANALTAPGYQAIVPMLVPRPDLANAVAANSAGVNVSRAVGPALGGAVLTAFGIAAPFWINAVSNFGAIGALIWWREPRRTAALLPPEHLMSAIRVGLRHARYNAPLSATLIRSAGFFLLQAPTGRCCRSWRGRRSAADRRCTAFCWARSAGPPWAPPSPCRGSTTGWAPTDWQGRVRWGQRQPPRCSAWRTIP